MMSYVYILGISWRAAVETGYHPLPLRCAAAITLKRRDQRASILSSESGALFRQPGIELIWDIHIELGS
jgi:hypothetical protein